MISVVIPAYNEEQMIARAACEIGRVLAGISAEYELLFIDDGSSDGTWKEIMKCSGQTSAVRGIRFSRNFGKEAAIMAGLEHASGDCCAVIDCDLQHPPQTLVQMYRLWEEGYEVIEGRKNSRGEESAAHAWAAKGFYTLISKATGMDMRDTSDFKLLDRKAVDALLRIGERSVFFRALSSWIGFRTTAVYYDVAEREAGESKWSTLQLVRYALKNISSFSAAPMQIVTLLGVLMLIVSLILGGISFTQKILGIAVDGFTTVILILLFTGSIIMISLGIIGYYIAKIYEEIKNRPRYLVMDECGKKN